jgi:hypothetical protein
MRIVIFLIAGKLDFGRDQPPCRSPPDPIRMRRHEKKKGGGAGHFPLFVHTNLASLNDWRRICASDGSVCFMGF